jgi:hypothetical protein
LAREAGDVARKGGADGGEDDERHVGFLGQAVDPVPTVHVLEKDQHAIGLALLDSLEERRHRGVVFDGLVFLM